MEDQLRSLNRLAQRYLAFGPVVTAYYYARCRAMVAPQARVQMTRRITFGAGSAVKAFAVINTTGGRVVFGVNCAVSCFNHIHAGEADVVIGDHVRLGSHVVIGGSERRFQDRDRLIVDQGSEHDGVRIGSDVLVGAGATILNGVTVGDGAVIGAGAVVTRDVPPYSIAVGIPAKVIGERS